MAIVNDADLGKKRRVFETDEPIKMPTFTPVRKETEVEVETRETVPVRRT